MELILGICIILFLVFISVDKRGPALIFLGFMLLIILAAAYAFGAAILYLLPGGA